MDLSMYDSLRALIETPKEHYINQMQALVDDRWENSTQTSFDVQIQKNIGSDAYIDVEISIDAAIDMGTGYKKGDDFKVFSHRDITTETPIGLMYKFANNYWITINTNNLASPVSSFEVRRCNNTLRWVNPYNGFINEVPCALDYELSSPQPLKDKDVITANGHVLVTVQGNELTKTITKNQRFIFNGQPFKVVGIQSLLNDDVDVYESNLFYIDMFLDMEQEEDDLVNNIANKTEYNYSITIDPPISKQVTGFKGQLSATVRLNGKVVDRTIVWEGNDFITIDSEGNYTLSEMRGKTATIKAYIKGNPNLYDTVNIQIVSAIENNYNIVVYPELKEVRSKIPVTFEVSLYNNGVKQDDIVEFKTDNSNVGNYTLTREDNIFTLSTLVPSTTPLGITFSVGDVSKTLDVLLKPFF